MATTHSTKRLCYCSAQGEEKIKLPKPCQCSKLLSKKVPLDLSAKKSSVAAKIFGNCGFASKKIEVTAKSSHSRITNYSKYQKIESCNKNVTSIYFPKGPLDFLKACFGPDDYPSPEIMMNSKNEKCKSKHSHLSNMSDVKEEELTSFILNETSDLNCKRISRKVLCDVKLKFKPGTNVATCSSYWSTRNANSAETNTSIKVNTNNVAADKSKQNENKTDTKPKLSEIDKVKETCQCINKLRNTSLKDSHLEQITENRDQLEGVVPTKCLCKPPFNIASETRHKVVKSNCNCCKIEVTENRDQLEGVVPAKCLCKPPSNIASETRHNVVKSNCNCCKYCICESDTKQSFEKYNDKKPSRTSLNGNCSNCSFSSETTTTGCNDNTCEERKKLLQRSIKKSPIYQDLKKGDKFVAVTNTNEIKPEPVEQVNTKKKHLQYQSEAVQVICTCDAETQGCDMKHYISSMSRELFCKSTSCESGCHRCSMVKSMYSTNSLEEFDDRRVLPRKPYPIAAIRGLDADKQLLMNDSYRSKKTYDVGARDYNDCQHCDALCRLMSRIEVITIATFIVCILFYLCFNKMFHIFNHNKCRHPFC